MVSKPRFCCSVEKITPISQCLLGDFTEIVLISYTFLNFFKLGIAKWEKIVYTSSSKRHRAIAKR